MDFSIKVDVKKDPEELLCKLIYKFDQQQLKDFFNLYIKEQEFIPSAIFETLFTHPAIDEVFLESILFNSLVPVDVLLHLESLYKKNSKIFSEKIIKKMEELTYKVSFDKYNISSYLSLYLSIPSCSSDIFDFLVEKEIYNFDYFIKRLTKHPKTGVNALDKILKYYSNKEELVNSSYSLGIGYDAKRFNAKLEKETSYYINNYLRFWYKKLTPEELKIKLVTYTMSKNHTLMQLLINEVQKVPEGKRRQKRYLKT